jgi:hypothetical protein
LNHESMQRVEDHPSEDLAELTGFAAVGAPERSKAFRALALGDDPGG